MKTNIVIYTLIFSLALVPAVVLGVDYEGAFVNLMGDAGQDYSAVFNDTGYIGIWTSPQGWVESQLLSYSTNTWYYVKRELDLDTNTGSFYVEELANELGNPANRNASYSVGRNPSHPNTYINDITIHSSNSHGAHCFIDELTVTNDSGTLFSENFDNYTVGEPPTSGWEDYYTGPAGNPNYTPEEAAALGVTIQINDEYSMSGESLRFLDTAGNIGSRVELLDSNFSSSTVVVEYYMMTIPEPATLSLLAIGGLTLIRRKK